VILSTWEDVLAVEDTDYTEIEIAKDKSVRLGTLSSADLLKWLEENDEKGVKDNGLKLVAQSLVDADGNRIGRLAEIIRLRDKAPKTVKKLVDAAATLNGLTVAKKVAEKNDSSEVPTDASPIDSPLPQVAST
jgi:hypothetical protein